MPSPGPMGGAWVQMYRASASAQKRHTSREKEQASVLPRKGCSGVCNLRLFRSPSLQGLLPLVSRVSHLCPCQKESKLTLESRGQPVARAAAEPSRAAPRPGNSQGTGLGDRTVFGGKQAAPCLSEMGGHGHGQPGIAWVWGNTRKGSS